MCFVCGRENPIGFHLTFFADEHGSVHADYTPREEHQGYPGVMHGGLVTALLDELIGRTAIASDLWCMTAKLQVRFRKPVPIGEMRLQDGTLVAEAEGVYLRIPEPQLQEYKSALDGWRVDE
jgi:hypothetical protein